MALTRWEPFREMMSLREAVDRLFEESVVRPDLGLAGGGRTRGFPIDVCEGEEVYEVRATLPGVRPDDIEVTTQGDTLTIRGTFQDEAERPDRRWIVRESQGGSFERTISFPMPIDANRVEARCENGVIALTLPKAEAARRRRIPIRTVPGIGEGRASTVIDQPAAEAAGRTQPGGPPPAGPTASDASASSPAG